ncbi:MAG: regulatory protein RecX [Bacteroidales bacterium]|jgi:regulatory protein|nr:regulatory protein RecX [Bacteroidales bacterium]
MKNFKKTSVHKALDKAQYLCAQKEKCVEDIKQKLFQWGVNKNDFDSIIERLIEEKFIDEERYAKAYVKEKFTFNKWGKIKIEYALKQKKIPDQYIQYALDDIPENEYTQTLEKELIKKRKSIQDTNEHTIKSKLIRFAVSKGFENGKVFDMVNSMIKE